MLEIIIDSHAVDQALMDLSRSLGDMTPAMTDIGEHIASLVDLNFRDAADPYGNPWAPLSAVTIARRHNHSSKPLNDTGALKASITANADRHSVEIGSNEKYAGTQQKGAAKGQYAPGVPWGDIPARHFLPTAEGGLPGDWEQDVLDIIRQHLERSI